MRKSQFEPCIPSRGTKVPNRPEWIHEIKHDGYCLIIRRDERIVTEHGDGTIAPMRSSPADVETNSLEV